MRRIGWLKIGMLVASVIFTSTICLSQAKVLERIPIRKHPYFAGHVLPALKLLVREYGKARINHLYVSPVDVFENGAYSALVYWKENNARVLWEPYSGYNKEGNHDPNYDLRDSRRYWRLKKDVVATLADVGGSSYLLTRSDAQRMVQDCRLRGEKYVVIR